MNKVTGKAPIFWMDLALQMNLTNDWNDLKFYCLEYKFGLGGAKHSVVFFSKVTSILLVSLNCTNCMVRTTIQHTLHIFSEQSSNWPFEMWSTCWLYIVYIRNCIRGQELGPLGVIFRSFVWIVTVARSKLIEGSRPSFQDLMMSSWMDRWCNWLTWRLPKVTRIQAVSFRNSIN